jgi:hypothetical protein
MDIAAEEVQVWIEYYSVAFVECHQLSVVKEIQVSVWKVGNLEG